MAMHSAISRRAFVALLLAPAAVACGAPTAVAPTALPASQTADTPKPAGAPASGSPSPAAGAAPPASPATGSAGASPAPTGPSASPAAAGQDAPSAAGPAGGTLTIASIGPMPPHLHPYPDSATYSDTWSTLAGYVWGGGLLEFDATNLEYKPYAASEYSVSPDGRTFTFKLRDGLKWSDGQPITVEDYLFAFQEASKEENDFVSLEELLRIESFTAPDPRTLVVTLRETLARDVATGAASVVSPVPRHVWQGKSWLDPVANPEIQKPTVTSGAFVLASWSTAEGATFERNPNWFKGASNVERIVYRPGQQPTVAYELLRSGQAQWAPAIPPAQYTEAKQNPAVTMYEWSPANGVYRLLEFNTTRDALKDKRVREALARALSRDDMIQVGENTLGQPQYTFLNPNNTRWYNPDVEKYDFDLARSKALLQEAGLRLEGSRLLGADGQQVKLQVMYPVTSNPRQKIATYMQQQYRQLGIELEVRGLDANAYFEEVQKMNYDLSLGTWGGGSIDPDLSSKAQYLGRGQQNRTGFNSERVNGLFQQGAVELDDAKRKQIYFEIQKVVNEELPSFFMHSALSFSPMAKSVTGVQPTRMDGLDVNDAITRWAIAR